MQKTKTKRNVKVVKKILSVYEKSFNVNGYLVFLTKSLWAGKRKIPGRYFLYEIINSKFNREIKTIMKAAEQ